MIAVILVAGEGTRMRPLTEGRSKVMLPIANRPILEHLLVQAKKAGIMEYVFVVGHKDKQIHDYFGDGDKWQVDIKYCTQKKQLGTSDAIKCVEGLVEGNFLVINGDNIIMGEDIKKIMEGPPTTMGVIDVINKTGLGVIEVNGDKVVHIYEKSKNLPYDTINCGVYKFTPEIFRFISKTPKSPREEYEITDSLQLMIDEGHDVYHQEFCQWLNLSHPWDLLAANEYLLRTIDLQVIGNVENNVNLKGMVSIGKGTLVRAGAYIIGPVIIGQNCDIGPNCYIRPHTSIGDNCHIGAAVEVKNSIIMRGTKIPHHNYIGDSIIGESCNFGAGTKIANLRLDKANIKVGSIDTQRRKLGAIIGDGVETGINACINVGSTIGNNTRIGPGTLAHGIIAPNSTII